MWSKKDSPLKEEKYKNLVMKHPDIAKKFGKSKKKPKEKPNETDFRKTINKRY